ncbi:hypothetical protein ACIRQP_38125 [Streptomyces sp. NPDC102274]|uniref:hypothetical protein n=1 Tax=Streptomyces sp. NPDC102274 TaxID=3366151 RepID=UPI0037F96D0A
MDIEALRHGNFASLGVAVDDWSTVIKNLTDMEKDAREDLRAKADKANWAGFNATVSREFISKTAGEFTDAVTQATTIRDILRDTRSELIKYRGDLNRAIDRGWDKHLTVVGTRGGGFSVSVNIHPEPPNSEQAVKALRDELQSILDNATTSDATAAEILRSIANQTEFGFGDAKYRDRDSAAEALKQADEMLKIARKDPKDLSSEELERFNRTLGKYRNDTLFAEKFATELGAKETLAYWNNTADAHAGARGAELNELKDLQKNLSMTLATATHSDSSAMKEWKQDIINESNTSFKADASNPTKPVGALGFQVMSSLMSHGKYDTEFLEAYGDKLLKADKAPHGSPGMGTNEVWNAGQMTDLVFGKDDGRDPMIGFMDALSHNAEASTNTFESKPTLDHVLQSTKYTDRGQSVGHALEAAVMGVAYGETPSGPVPHNRVQTEIMQNVMHAVAQPDSGADLVDKAIGESFGHMASAYMPEINRVMAGPGAESIFLSNSTAPDDLLEKIDTTRFLYEVARDDNGRAAIHFGESIYTSSLLEAHIADDSRYDGDTTDAIRTITENTGVIEGIVGRSYADADISSALEGQKENNDALKNQGDFYKSVLSAGLGVGAVALAPQNLTGAMAGAGAGGFFGGIAGMAVDRLMSGREMDGALDDALYRTGQGLNESLDSATRQTQSAAQDAIDKHESELPHDATKNLVREALKEGWTQSDTMLEDSHKRPSA